LVSVHNICISRKYKQLQVLVVYINSTCISTMYIYMVNTHIFPN
jgi:hypothetical protein